MPCHVAYFRNLLFLSIYYTFQEINQIKTNSQGHRDIKLTGTQSYNCISGVFQLTFKGFLGSTFYY